MSIADSTKFHKNEGGLSIITAFIIVMFNITMTILLGMLGCMQCTSARGGHPMQLSDTEMHQSTNLPVDSNIVQENVKTVQCTKIQCLALYAVGCT